MHHKNSAELHSQGKRIVVKPKFFVNSASNLEKCFRNNNNECLNYIKNQYLQNFLFKGVPSNFMVWNPRNWQIHPFNFINPDKKFEIFSESENSIQAVKLGKLCFGFFFCISSKYPPTVRILENFLEYIYGYIHKTGYKTRKIRVTFFLILGKSNRS